MIGILIVTHGRFGIELVKSAELIVGKQEGVKALCLEHGGNIGQLSEDVHQAIKELNEKYEVLVLTDMFGGSPTNVAAANMEKLKFKCLTGVNLPMLLEAVLSRREHDTDVNDLAEKCLRAGVEGVRDIDHILGKL